MGAVSVRDEALAGELRTWRSHTGALLGPFEAWLAHRSLATLGLRLERSTGQRPRASRRRSQAATTSPTSAGPVSGLSLR